MTEHEVLQRIRLNQSTRLSLSALARKAGIDRNTLITAIRTGRLSQTAANAVARAIQVAEREGYHIPRPHA